MCTDIITTIQSNYDLINIQLFWRAENCALYCVFLLPKYILSCVFHEFNFYIIFYELQG